MRLKLECLLALVFASCVTSACWGGMQIGKIYPRDSDYLVGSNVSLTCLLNETVVANWTDKDRLLNPSTLTITFGQKVLPDMYFVNDLEVAVTVRNGQPENSGGYYCNVMIGDIDTVVCPTNINFGYKPQNVTGFKCRVYEWSNLTCTWTPPKNTVSVQYTLEYSIYGYNYNQQLNCPSKKPKTACSWAVSTLPVYMRVSNKLYFTLNGTNSLGNITQKFAIDHYSIVIPGAPQNLHVTQKTATDMLVSWNHPKEMSPDKFKPGVCYRLTYKDEYNYVVDLDTRTNNENVLSGLIPNLWYTIQVKGRSCSANADAEADLWSPTVSISERTQQDIPWQSPEAQETFFDVVNYKDTRTVKVYWKHLDIKKQHGGSFHYDVSITKTFLHRKRRGTEENRKHYVEKNHYTFYSLELNSAYLVKIWSVNAMGPSENFTSIHIPTVIEMPSRPLHVRPVFENGTYRITWDKPSTPVDEYTLIWCQGEQRCETSLESKNVYNNIQVLPLKGGDYDFAVAAKSRDSGLGSGLEWAQCTVYKNRGVDRVGGVTVEAIGSHKVKISWKLACDSQKALVEKYQVFMCENRCPSSACLGNVSKIVSSNESNEDSAIFDGLIPYTNYSFSVVAISSAGNSSASPAKCVTTSQDAPSDSPYNITVLKKTNTTVKLSWHSPSHPNGIIDSYRIYCKPVQQFVPFMEFREYKPNLADVTHSYLLDELICFTNYSISVSACVKQFCSNSSKEVHVQTAVGVPGPMDPPRTEVLNNSHVRVIWKAPEHANGPLNYYLLHLFKRESDNLTRLDQVNVTSTSVDLPHDCSPNVHSSGNGAHLFSVQAVNLVSGDDFLYGPVSNITKTKLCLGPDMNSTFVIGVIVGSTIALAIVIFCLYNSARWMKSKVDKMAHVEVELPIGLQKPHSVDEYNKQYRVFERGLPRQGSDPNMSPKLGRRHLDSFNEDNNDNNTSDDSFKNRHGSGTSHLSATSTDELIGKQNHAGQVTAPRSMPGSKVGGKGERNPSGDSSSGHDSISSSLTHRTNLSTDGSSSSQEANTQGKDPRSSRDSGLDEESKPFVGLRTLNAKALPQCPSPSNNHYLPTAPYSKLGLMDGSHIGDYLPLARGRHLSLYNQNLANSEPSITDLNQHPYTLNQHVHQEPPSPDVPYSKFGMSHSVTDLMLDSMELPDSPVSSNASPQEALPYSRFGLRRPPPPSQRTPYVTMGMALLMAPQRDPKELLSSKVSPVPFVLKSPSKKEKPEELQVELLSTPDEAYSKLGVGPVLDQGSPQKTQPYLTMQEVKESEQNHSLPDLTISSSREESPTHQAPGQFQHGVCEVRSANGYLPHLLIPSLTKAPEPVLPDLVNCSSVSSVSAAVQETPEVKVQAGNNGYVSLNQVLANNTNA